MSNAANPTKPATREPTRDKEAIVSAYVAKARQQYATPTPDLEIDDEPQVSIAASGAWVAAWVWVNKEEVGIGNLTRPRAKRIRS
ncbi:MAG: hypothetical protein ABSA42_16690 [Terracidiphilus sp.]|jgi:hypothetical protein